MNRDAVALPGVRRSRAILDELTYAACGLGFTFALFFTMSRFENNGVTEHPIEIEDMRGVAMPFTPPPPRVTPTEPVAVPEAAVPLTGIDAGSTDSAVRIAVVPPDLEALVPQARAPSAQVDIARLYTELKPRTDITADARHVYQQTEVDQPPRAIVRVAAAVTPAVFGKMPTLNVTLLLVIDTDGRAESVRIMKPSGKPEFDAIVAKTVKDEWRFTPAMRRGKKVKCLAEQPFRMTLSSSSSSNIL